MPEMVASSTTVEDTTIATNTVPLIKHARDTAVLYKKNKPLPNVYYSDSSTLENNGKMDYYIFDIWNLSKSKIKFTFYFLS
jgi:hypothetical protein